MHFQKAHEHLSHRFSIKGDSRKRLLFSVRLLFLFLYTGKAIKKLLDRIRHFFYRAVNINRRPVADSKIILVYRFEPACRTLRCKNRRAVFKILLDFLTGKGSCFYSKQHLIRIRSALAYAVKPQYQGKLFVRGSPAPRQFRYVIHIIQSELDFFGAFIRARLRKAIRLIIISP